MDRVGKRGPPGTTTGPPRKKSRGLGERVERLPVLVEPDSRDHALVLDQPSSAPTVLNPELVPHLEDWEEMVNRRVAPLPLMDPSRPIPSVSSVDAELKRLDTFPFAEAMHNNDGWVVTPEYLEEGEEMVSRREVLLSPMDPSCPIPLVSPLDDELDWILFQPVTEGETHNHDGGEERGSGGSSSNGGQEADYADWVGNYQDDGESAVDYASSVVDATAGCLTHKDSFQFVFGFGDNGKFTRIVLGRARKWVLRVLRSTDEEERKGKGQSAKGGRRPLWFFTKRGDQWWQVWEKDDGTMVKAKRKGDPTASQYFLSFQNQDHYPNWVLALPKRGKSAELRAYAKKIKDNVREIPDNVQTYNRTTRTGQAQPRRLFTWGDDPRVFYLNRKSQSPQVKLYRSEYNLDPTLTFFRVGK